MIFTADDAELDEEAVKALAIAQAIAAAEPVIDWPPLPKPLASLPLNDRMAARRLLLEQYLFGIVYCALTVEASFELQGAILQFPALEQAGAIDHIARLISYETLLPFLNADVTPQQAKMLADRLRGVAAICDTFAAPKAP